MILHTSCVTFSYFVLLEQPFPFLFAFALPYEFFFGNLLFPLLFLSFLPLVPSVRP